MSVPSAHENFDQWLDAYLKTHPMNPEPELRDYTLDDMFSAWVGGAIFTANRMFNPSRPNVPPLPDIFQTVKELPEEPSPMYESPHYLGGRPYDSNPEDATYEPGTD
jgi:hypothetical protein